MAANRILYVNCNPATLVRDEQLLMQAGYEVDSVFGADGLMACVSLAEYASVLIDRACPIGHTTKMTSWLRLTYPTIGILPTTDCSDTQQGDNAGPMVGDICLGETTRACANDRAS
jgi:hypothetical protein